MDNLSDTQKQMALDFGAAVFTGGGLALAQYLLGSQEIDWRPLGAAVLIGAIAAGRKWTQAHLLQPPSPHG